MGGSDGVVRRRRLGRGSPRCGDAGRDRAPAGQGPAARRRGRDRPAARADRRARRRDDGEGDPQKVLVGIETDRGPWVAALVAAGYTVFAVNPRQVARYRERHGMSGAKSDAGDAHALADMVRTDAHQLRSVAGDSALVEGIKVVARAHQTLIWERHAAPAAAARGAARVLPRRAGGLRRPRRRRHARAARAPRRTRPRRPGCRGPGSPRRCAGPAATTSRPEAEQIHAALRARAAGPAARAGRRLRRDRARGLPR